MDNNLQAIFNYLPEILWDIELNIRRCGPLFARVCIDPRWHTDENIDSVFYQEVVN